MQEEISKTQRKKEMHELQKLGVELVALSAPQLENILLDEKLRNAVLEAKRIRSHEAKRRQMQYIGRLMREVDAAPIRAQLDGLNQGSAASAAAHQRVEAWREKLLADEVAFTEFVLQFPGCDLQQLRNLVRSVKRDLENGKPPRSNRELFRFIKECSASSRS
jgi:ribosome-associated protein